MGAGYCRYSLHSSLFRLLSLEHLQHPIGDQVAAHRVEHRQEHRGKAQQTRKQASVLLAGDQNRAHHGDRRNRVGERHQRRVQQRRHTANQLKAQEGRQHEYPQIEFVLAHYYFAPPARTGVSPSFSITRVCTTSPPCVTRVSRMISSSRLMFSSPLFTISFKNAATFEPYIWLA